MRVVLTLLILTAVTAAQQNNPTPPPQGTRRDPGFFKGEKPKKGEDENQRAVMGYVRGDRDDPVEGAVVQIKDTKTLKMRSYITLADGAYRFHGLSSNTDYELRARFKDLESDQKTLSVYDNRRTATINLKVEKKEAKKTEP